MNKPSNRLSADQTRGLRAAKELERHLLWLDSFTPGALAVLALASGIYTYLGVSSILEDNDTTVFAAVAYSLAVSVGIFVFWSYMLRLLPAMRTAGGYLWLTLAMVLGCTAIIAMSSWLNAAALAGSAAVEEHLENTTRQYQTELEQAYEIALSGQALEQDVRRAREAFEALAQQESRGELSGTAGEGAVFRVLTQKTEELSNLEAQIRGQTEPIQQAYDTGNAVISSMRGLTVGSGSVEDRSLLFSEESLRMAGVIASLNQYSIAPVVARAARDLPASVVLPELDGRSTKVRAAQSATITSVLAALDQRSKSLAEAAQEVLDMTPPQETAYNPISAADAVIRYAGHFVPSWAGAIAIDLLPGVLVFILAVTQAAIRRARDGMSVEQTLTLAELRAAMDAMREVEETLDDARQSRSGSPDT
jgi:hypothetical protein